MPPPTTLRGSASLSKIFAATATSPPNSTQNSKDVATRRRSCSLQCLCQFQGFLRDRGPYHFLQLFGVVAKKSFRGVWRGQANPTAPRHAHWPSVSKIPTPTTGSTTTPSDLKNGTPKILGSGARANRCPLVANRGGVWAKFRHAINIRPATTTPRTHAPQIRSLADAKLVPLYRSPQTARSFSKSRTAE